MSLELADDSTYAKASEELIRTARQIKDSWELNVRDQVLAAEGKSTAVLVNSVGVFLKGLALGLSKKDLALVLSMDGMSELHGEQRAKFSGYFLPQLLKEFSILRSVIYKELQSSGILTFEIRNFIDAAIDSVVSLPVNEFSNVQNRHTENDLKRAETSNQELERFAAIAAHDLRSPVSTISGYLDLISDDFSDQLPTEVQDYIQRMQAASKRMLNLIHRLLEYAQLIEMNRDFQKTDIQTVLNNTIQNLDHMIKETSAVVTHNQMPVVMGDIDLLNQLFQNLITNAIKFRGKDPPKIHIECKADKANWLFFVSDNGIGFDPKQRDEIFFLYKKLHSDSEYQGSGIGLATCRKVVELHGGKIWADSSLGEGSVFKFTLPKINEASALKQY